MITLNSLFHGAEFVRLQRMRSQKPQEVMLLQSLLHDNSLRSKIQRLICLRRLKHASLIGRYYWIRGRYQTASLDFNLHDMGLSNDQQFATYGALEDGKRHFHHMRNNLDISDVGVGLGLDLECFSSFLAASAQMDSKSRFILRNNKSGKAPRLKKSDLRKLTEILDDDCDPEQMRQMFHRHQEFEREAAREAEAMCEIAEIFHVATPGPMKLETVMLADETLYAVHDMSPTQDSRAMLDMQDIANQHAEPVVPQGRVLDDAQVVDDMCTKLIQDIYEIQELSQVQKRIHEICEMEELYQTGSNPPYQAVLDMQLVQDLQMMEELQALQELHLMHELQLSQQQATAEEQAVVDSLIGLQLAEIDPLFAEELSRTANYLAELKKNRRRKARAKNIASTMPKTLAAPIKRKSVKAVRITRTASA